MSRAKWIQEMIDSKKSEEEIIDSILKGDEAQGIKPMTGDGAKTFAKLNYKKILNKKPKNVPPADQNQNG